MLCYLPFNFYALPFIFNIVTLSSFSSAFLQSLGNCFLVAVTEFNLWHFLNVYEFMSSCSVLIQ